MSGKRDEYSEGRLLGTINTIGNALLLGILFLVCSIPVVTLGTSLSAFYYAMIKSVRKGRGYPVKEFFAAFRRNLGKGTGITLMAAAVAFLLLLNRGIFLGKEDDGAMTWVVIYDALLMFLAALAVWIFPVISRFSLSFWRTLSLTFVIACRYLHFTLLLMAGWAVSVMLCLKLSVGFTLIIPALFCYLSTFVIEKAFAGYIPKPSENEDGWYYNAKD